MSLPPVTKARISEAARTLQNADAAAVACRIEGLDFFVACALLEKESGGANVYGHDKGGALAGYPGEVDESNYTVFTWLRTQGYASNGVGPTQITYPGYFTAMAAEDLKAWEPVDNMRYGFRLLLANYKRLGSWEKAGAAYNGGPTPNATARTYGRDLSALVDVWKPRILRAR